MNTNTKMRGTAQETRSMNGGMQSSQLMKLFEDELKDLYWAEKAITRAIPRMIKSATSVELIDTLSNHLIETGVQIKRLEKIFESMGKKVTAKKCEAMEGLIVEGRKKIDECEKGAMRDAVVISTWQKIEHYEIATYGALLQFAEILGLTRVESILETTLDEEKAADEKLSEVTQSIIQFTIEGK